MIENTRKNPKQQRALQTIDYIYEATTQLLNRSNPRNLTTNHIAERTGISIGTLYRYFRNKEELLDSLVRAQARKSFAKAYAVLEDQEVNSADELIEKLVDLSLSAFDRQPFVRRHIYKMVGHRPSLREFLRDERARIFEVLEARLVHLEPLRFRHLEEEERQNIVAAWRGILNSIVEDDPEQLNRDHTKRFLIRTVSQFYSRETSSCQQNDSQPAA